MSRIKFSFWVRHWISRVDIRPQSCNNSLLFCNDFLHGSNLNSSNCIARKFSTSGSLLKEDKFKDVKPTKLYIGPTGKVEKRKLPTGEQIFLLKDGSDRKKLYLSEAQKIAKHEGLRLVRVGVDYQTAIYKLVSASDFVDDTLNKSTKKESADKKIKHLLISQSSAEHDIQYKIKNLIKSVKKGWRASVIIEKGSKSEKSKEIMDAIESLIPPDCEITEKVEKKSRISFLIIHNASVKDNNNNNEGIGENKENVGISGCEEQDEQKKSSRTNVDSEVPQKRAENVD